MSITHVLVILLRRGWLVLLALLTTMVVAGSILLFTPSRYDATATASIDPGNIDPISEQSGGVGPIMLMQGNILSLVISQRVSIDVVRRLSLTANPQIQQAFRDFLGSFGRESIDEWMASSLVKSVDPKFIGGTNVLAIKYKSGEPEPGGADRQRFSRGDHRRLSCDEGRRGRPDCALVCAAARGIAQGSQASRQALETFQTQTNMVAPVDGGDSETSQYMAISGQLSAARAQLNTLQSRLSSGSTPTCRTIRRTRIFRFLAGLKEKVSTAQTSIEAAKGVFGSNNPKMVAEQANLAANRKQIGEATEKMRQHLNERIATTQNQIASLEAEQAQAQKTLIGVQAQRSHLQQLEHEVAFRADQPAARQRASEEAKLKSKLTFSDMTVLDKATPPITPSFPKPFQVISVGIAAGLVLGLLLALLAEATDRRVRFPIDLEHAAQAPFLGSLDAVRHARKRVGSSHGALRPA